jgi:hypothetical protein
MPLVDGKVVVTKVTSLLVSGLHRLAILSKQEFALVKISESELPDLW